MSTGETVNTSVYENINEQSTFLIEQKYHKITSQKTNHSWCVHIFTIQEDRSIL